MFELKYKITDADVKAVNKSVALQYFVAYVLVALLGIAVGIAATVLRPSTIMLVLGIILLIFGCILLVCSILLAVAPKNFVMSVLMPSDELERSVTVEDRRITVKTEGSSDIVFTPAEVTKVKLKNNNILAFIGKAQVLIIKDAIVSGGTLGELYNSLRGTNVSAPAASKSAPVEENQNALNIEPTDGEEAPEQPDNHE